MSNLKQEKIEFNVTTFEKEIEKKKIPLLDLDYEITRVDMHYEMFKLDVTRGSSLLMNKQVNLIPHIHSKSEENLKKDRKIKIEEFTNWILPQIRTAIDFSNQKFKAISQDSIKHRPYWELDHSLWFQSNSTTLVKKRAIDLISYITSDQWNKYHSFSLFDSWCFQNSSTDLWYNYTHLIVDKEGEEIWVIMMLEYL